MGDLFERNCAFTNINDTDFEQSSFNQFKEENGDRPTSAIDLNNDNSGSIDEDIIPASDSSWNCQEETEIQLEEIYTDNNSNDFHDSIDPPKSFPPTISEEGYCDIKTELEQNMLKQTKDVY
ncbi:hypothetical protein GCK72_002057 [Caenorhabditis remanei]|uniref:Uncharacterized protein n=1 Tax=Caenorhabditis remanei TaxID=31234 RepID=A0A6A5HRB1_CAERE|nr:hypothetical protein GCK72_002057 [Caenorhabditis remanei]KAF1770239.1 hypothetical protein GCK72_002057 [Caenorhabditis remanei]